MGELKLAKIPDRTPVKLSVQVSPQLQADLTCYADAYEAAYGQREEVADLIPFMLASYLDTDRGFARFRAKGSS